MKDLEEKMNMSSFILVTVGTSSFDPLIKVVDEMIGDGRIKHRVIAQIGQGKYIPKNMKYFRLAKNFSDILWSARIVITTGGAGTIIDCLQRRKLIIGVENTEVSESHQAELLEKMHDEQYLVWAKELKDIPLFVDDYWKHYSGPLRHFNPPILDLRSVLEEVVNKR